MAGQSITFDFISRGGPELGRQFKSTGDNAAAAARGAKVLQDVIKTLGEKENRTAAESRTLAAALRQTGDAEDRAAAKALAADIAIRRLDDALKDSGKNAASAKGGFGGLAGEVTGFGAASTAASSKSSMFAKALAGINLASGVLEPALAGVVVAAGGLASGLAAAGAGIGVFGAVAKTVVAEATKAATAYAAAQAKMSAATTPAQRVAALKAEKAAFAGLSPPVKTLATELGNTQKMWKAFTDAAAPGVVGVISGGLGLLPKILASMKPFLTPVETALRGIIGQLNTGLSSAGFKSFIDLLAKNTGPAITKIATAAGNVAVGIGGILKAFMPASQQMLGGIDKITARFREWGTTLSGGTGFQSLMTTFKTETPQAVAILRNLGTVLGNVGKAMFGLSTFSNSKMLLQALLPLSGVLASLSRNTALTRIALYLLAIAAAGRKLEPAFTGIKAAVAFFPAAAASVAAFAGAAEGATVAQVIAAAATRAWGLAMDALPWVALAAAVVVVAVLVIKYHTQIWHFMIRVWNDILGVIMGVWHWVQANWPLLLAIITGPIGIAALAVIKNWQAITGAARAAWNTIAAGFRWLVDQILGVFSGIIHGAAAAFGWVPGLGSRLKGAAKAFDQFRADVNASLGGINGRTVNVSVAMTSSTNPYPGGISGRKAAGGKITGPGGPRADTAGVFALSNGEWVIQSASAARYGPAAMDAVNQGRAVIKYAGGGAVGVNVAAHTPAASSVESSLMASVTKLAKAFASAAGTGSGISVPVGSIGGGVMRWQGLVLQALRMENLGAYLASQVLYQMMTESGGNPNAINLTDSNAAAGDPSRGLLQTIMSTFMAYHWPGTSFNIYDPLANIAAAINYARHRYGPSLMSGGMGMGSGHGYAAGTPAAAPGWAWVGERGPELVRFSGGEQVIPAAGGLASGGSVAAKGAADLRAWRAHRQETINLQIEHTAAAQHTAAVLAGARLPKALHQHYVTLTARDKAHLNALVAERTVMRDWRSNLAASDASLHNWIAAAGKTKSLQPAVRAWQHQLAGQEHTIGEISLMLGLTTAQLKAYRAALAAKGKGKPPVPTGVQATHTYGGDVTDTIGAFLAAAASPFTGTTAVMDRGGWLRPGFNSVYNGTGRPEPVGAARGGGTVRLEISSGGSSAFDAFMIAMIRKYVKVKGGTGPGAADRAFAAH